MPNLPLATQSHSTHSLSPHDLNHDSTGQSSASMAKSCNSIARDFIQGSIEQVRQKTSNVLNSGSEINSSKRESKNIPKLSLNRSKKIPPRMKGFEAAINQSVQRLWNVKSQDFPPGSSTRTKAYENQWELANALSPVRMNEIVKNLQSPDLAKRNVANDTYHQLSELHLSSETLVPVFRGVNGGEPGVTRYTESTVSGRTVRYHGHATAPGKLADVHQHAHLNSASSTYLSFTTKLEVAAKFSGRNGNVLVAYVPNGSLIMSPNGYSEHEVLILGKVYFNNVLNPKEGLGDLSADDLEPEFKAHDEHMESHPSNDQYGHYTAY